MELEVRSSDPKLETKYTPRAALILFRALEIFYANEQLTGPLPLQEFWQ